MIPGPLPVPCVSSLVQLCAQNCDHLPPTPTHTFLKWPFPTDFEKHTHTPPPPPVTTFWCIGLKVEKSREKCEFAQCWHKLNVPERCVSDTCFMIHFMIRAPVAGHEKGRLGLFIGWRFPTPGLPGSIARPTPKGLQDCSVHVSTLPAPKPPQSPLPGLRARGRNAPWGRIRTHS